MRLIGLTLLVAMLLSVTFVLVREAMEYGIVYAVGLLLVVSVFVVKLHLSRHL